MIISFLPSSLVASSCSNTDQVETCNPNFILEYSNNLCRACVAGETNDGGKSTSCSAAVVVVPVVVPVDVPVVVPVNIPDDNSNDSSGGNSDDTPDNKVVPNQVLVHFLYVLSPLFSDE